jgi:UDP-glucose 4-epimerase
MTPAPHHLILGGTGFIGRHVALLLARAGFGVTITGRSPPGFAFPEDCAHRIGFLQLDIAAPDWDAAIGAADVVHHYLWTGVPGREAANPEDGLRANVGATIGLLEAFRRRGNGRLVFLSSGGTIYGRLNGIPAGEDHPIAPITPYGAEKAVAELYLRHYQSRCGLDIRIARVANVYGAGQDPARGLGAVTTFIVQALAGRTISIYGDGTVIRDYIHISDVAAVLATLGTLPAPRDCAFNIGNGAGTSLNDIVSILEAHLGRRLDVQRQAARPCDVPISVLAIGRAQAQLNWSPRLSVRAGVARTIADVSAGRVFSTLDPWSPAGAEPCYLKPSSSTSKISVAPGGIKPPAPRWP